MAPPPPPVNGDHEPQSRTVTVLVTGFGPFQNQFPVNPSFEIAKSLPERLTSSPEQPVQVRVIGYGTPIRVSYNEVRDLVPALHESFQGTVDIVIHIGMASGRTFYEVERYAHRDGYDKNYDLDKVKLPTDDGEQRFGDCPATMTTSLDYDDLFKRWQSNVAEISKNTMANGDDIDVRMSHDAGHYLCDYIYFNSLAWWGRKNNMLEGGTNTDRPVLFLHVPPESDDEAIKKGRVVTTALIQAAVDSWAAGTRKA